MLDSERNRIFGDWLDAHKATLFKVVRAYAFEHADRQDLFQEVAIQVWRSVDAYRGQSSLLSWIYGIAKNTINNQIRRARAQEQRIERAQSDLVRDAGHALETCTPEERLDLRRCAEAIDAALSSVTSWQAEVFVLRHFEGMSIAEIGAAMELEASAAKQSVLRAVRKVRQVLAPALGVSQ